MRYAERSCPSPLGPLLLAAAEGRLAGVWFEGQAHFGRAPELPAEREAPGPSEEAVLEAAVRWLERYFRGEEPGALPPLRLAGTAFQRALWALLLEIPRGETRSYSQLAAALGSSPRAVGRALGRNPLSILVPCHRVLGADGSLTGYAGGRDRKARLLALEQTRR